MQVVSPGYLEQNNLPRPDGAGHQGGVARVFVIADGVVAGSIAMSETIRPEYYAAVKDCNPAASSA